MLRYVVILALLVLSRTATPQSSPYMDADNPGQAVGLLKAAVVTAQAVLDECTRRNGHLATAMRSNLEQWQTKERSNLIKVEYYWLEMKRKEPRLSESEKYLAQSTRRQFELLEQMPRPSSASAAPSEVIRQYCEKYFVDLASGVWRERTPRAYRYMDEAPDPPQ